MADALALIAAALALAGCVTTLLGARAVAALARRGPAAGPALEASILKPLHGAAPGLAETLRGTLAQHHAAPFEVLGAVPDPGDAAMPIAEAAGIVVISDATLHGPNRKASQLVNLSARARHDVLVAVDDDIAVPPGWLTAVTAPLADPGVGLVTCLYRGEAVGGGLWSRLAALGIDWHFLPNAALGESLGRARGCYGATIALRRETLERIGGYQAVCALLADDHALGAAVRRLGLRVVLAPVLPAHLMAEPTLAALLAHELRWARTVRVLDFGGYAGLALAHPLAWGALAAALAPAGVAWGWAVLAAALVARVTAVVWVDFSLPHKVGEGRGGGAISPESPGSAMATPLPNPPPQVGEGFFAHPLPRLALLPLRDVLSFAIWLAGLARGTVLWQGHRYRMDRDGRMIEVGTRESNTR